MPATSASWKYSRAGKLGGPVTRTELNALIQGGGLAPDDLVWSKEIGSWTPVSELKDAITSQAITDPVGAVPDESARTSTANQNPLRTATPSHSDRDESVKFPAEPVKFTPPGPSTAVHPAHPTGASSSWKTSRAGVIRGGQSAMHVVLAHDAGELAADDLVYSSQVGSWQPLGSVLNMVRKAAVTEVAVAAKQAAAERPPVPATLSAAAVAASPTGPALPPQPPLPPAAVKPAATPPPVPVEHRTPPPVPAITTSASSLSYSIAPGAPQLNLSPRPAPSPVMESASQSQESDDVGFSLDDAPPRLKPPPKPLMKRPEGQLLIACCAAVLIAMLVYVLIGTGGPDDKPGLALIAEADALSQQKQYAQAAAKYREAAEALKAFSATNSTPGGKGYQRATEESARLDRVVRRALAEAQANTAANATPAVATVAPPPARTPVPAVITPPRTAPTTSPVVVMNSGSPTPATLPPATSPASVTASSNPPSAGPLPDPSPKPTARNAGWTYLLGTVPGFELHHDSFRTVGDFRATGLPPGYSVRHGPRPDSPSVLNFEISTKDPRTLSRKIVLQISVDRGRALLRMDDIFVNLPPSFSPRIELLDHQARVSGTILLLPPAADLRVQAVVTAMDQVMLKESKLDAATKAWESASREVERCDQNLRDLEAQYQGMRNRGATTIALSEVRRKYEAMTEVMAELKASFSMAAAKEKSVQRELDQSLDELDKAAERCIFATQ